MVPNIYYDFNGLEDKKSGLRSHTPEVLDAVSMDFIKDRFDNRNSTPKKWTKFVLVYKNNKYAFEEIDEDLVNPWQNDAETILENVKQPGVFVPCDDKLETMYVWEHLNMCLADTLTKKYGNEKEIAKVQQEILDECKNFFSFDFGMSLSGSVPCLIDIQNLPLTEDGKEKLQEYLAKDESVFFVDYREDEEGNSAISVLMNKDNYCDYHKIEGTMQDYPVLDQCFDNKWIDTKGMILDEDSDLPFDYSCSTVERVEQNDLNGEYVPYYQKEISDTSSFADRDYLKEKLEEYSKEFKGQEREI